METSGVAPVPPSDELIVRAAWCIGNRVHIENNQVIYDFQSNYYDGH